MIKIFAIVVFSVSIFLVSSVYSIYRKPLYIENPIDEMYRPGKVSYTVHCTPYSYPANVEDVFPCDNGRYFFVWNWHTRMIFSVSVFMPEKRPIGDYILAWGTPVGERNHGSCRDIYWTDISAYICSREPITPSTPAYMFTMTTYPIIMDKWSGFSKDH